MIRYKHDDESGTSWPVDVDTAAGEPSVQWIMRYAPTEAVIDARFQAASIASAYAALVDPDITQGEAIDKLKRARRCAAQAWKEAK